MTGVGGGSGGTRRGALRAPGGPGRLAPHASLSRPRPSVGPLFFHLPARAIVRTLAPRPDPCYQGRGACPPVVGQSQNPASLNPDDARMTVLFILLAAILGLTLVLMGGMMFWNILSAYGVSKGPDAFASRHRFFVWLLKRTRVDPYPRTSSKWVLWWRLVVVWSMGALMLSLGFRWMQ